MELFSRIFFGYFGMSWVFLLLEPVLLSFYYHFPQIFLIKVYCQTCLLLGFSFFIPIYTLVCFSFTFSHIVTVSLLWTYQFYHRIVFFTKIEIIYDLTLYIYIYIYICVCVCVCACVCIFTALFGVILSITLIVLS